MKNDIDEVMTIILETAKHHHRYGIVFVPVPAVNPVDFSELMKLALSQLKTLQILSKIHEMEGK